MHTEEARAFTIRDYRHKANALHKYNEADACQVHHRFYGHIHKLGPEDYLCLAMIKQALYDLKRDKLRREVLRWINGECDKHDYYPLSFSDCCEAVGLDPCAARKAIQGRKG